MKCLVALLATMGSLVLADDRNCDLFTSSDNVQLLAKARCASTVYPDAQLSAANFSHSVNGAQSLACVYQVVGGSFSCIYNAQTGALDATHSAATCPTSSLQPDSCGSECYSGCPNTDTWGGQWTGTTVVWEAQTDPDTLTCTYEKATSACQYHLDTGTRTFLPFVDDGCPLNSAEARYLCFLGL